jgi:cytochrome b pre-mRNA-processing protein 3
VLFEKLFRPNSARIAGRELYDCAIAQARQPALYMDMAVPDTVEGRFEMHNIHVLLLLHRLKGQGVAAADAAQALFDTYVSALDGTLREMGVGDLTVPKRMRKLGEAFYGRTKAYDATLADPDDRAGLERLIARTVYDEAQDAPAGRMADYVRRQAAALAAQPLDAILEGRPTWAVVLP